MADFNNVFKSSLVFKSNNPEVYPVVEADDVWLKEQINDKIPGGIALPKDVENTKDLKQVLTEIWASLQSLTQSSISGNTLNLGIGTSEDYPYAQLFKTLTIPAGTAWKYKGSKNAAEFLAIILSADTVGDIYNVTEDVIVDGVRYPAYTNFICIEKDSGTYGWDSFGGHLPIASENTAGIIKIGNGLFKDTNDKLNIKLGSYFELEGDSNFKLRLGSGLRYDKDGNNNSMLSVSIGTGIKYSANGDSVILDYSTEYFELNEERQLSLKPGVAGGIIIE